jgi:hypothetical protein
MRADSVGLMQKVLRMVPQYQSPLAALFSRKGTLVLLPQMGYSEKLSVLPGAHFE